jgi:hypothetical protein
MAPTLEESVDIYRTARATAWSYRLADYEAAARADLLKVVEEAQARLATRLDAVRSSSRPSSRPDSFTQAKIRDTQAEMERIRLGLEESLGKGVVSSSSRVGSMATDEHMRSLSLDGVISQANTVALSPSQFSNLLLKTPPGGIPIPKIVAGMLDRVGLESLQKGILDELRLGALTGASYDNIVRNLNRSFGVLLPHQLTTLTRTYFQTANAKAFDEVYKANKDILIGKIWTSANDDRVCLLCLPLGGTFYKFGETHPPMPRHPRCRCLFRPKTKSLKELGLSRKAVAKTVEPIVTRGTLINGKWVIPPVNTRTRSAATAITAMPGGLKQGFSMLPQEAQLAMLGPGRYELYKVGAIAIDDLVDRKTGALRLLDELREMATPGAKEAKALAAAEFKAAKALAKADKAAAKAALIAAKDADIPIVVAPLPKKLGRELFVHEGKSYTENLLPQAWVREFDPTPASLREAYDYDNARRLRLVEEVIESGGKGEASIQRIPLSDLRTYQSTVLADQVAEMAADFSEAKYKADGLPVVFRLPNGANILKDGNHRINAALLAGKESLEFEVYDIAKRAEELRKAKEAARDLGRWASLEKVDTSDMPLALGMRDVADPKYRKFLMEIAEKGEYLEPIPETRWRKVIDTTRDGRYSLDKPRSVYIGMDSDKLAALGVGDSWAALGARSATWADEAVDFERARRYGSTVFKVELPAGTFAVPARVMGMDEVVLLPGSRFEIYKIVDGVRHARLIDDGRMYVHELDAFMDKLKKTAAVAASKADEAKKAAVLAEEIKALEKAEAARRAKEAADKAASASKWDKLPKAKDRDIPGFTDVDWKKLDRADEVTGHLERAARTQKGIEHIISDKTLSRLHKAATDTDFALTKDTPGLFSMKSIRIEAMYKGDEFVMQGGRIMTLGDDLDAFQHVSAGAGKVAGGQVYRIVVKQGAHAIPITDDVVQRMALLPGARVRIGKLVNGIRELELLDDGRDYVKKIATLFDQVEMAAGRKPVFGTPVGYIPKVENIVAARPYQGTEPRPLTDIQKKALLTVQKRAKAAEEGIINDLMSTYGVDRATIVAQLDEIRDGFRTGKIELASNTSGSAAMYENLMTAEGRFKNQFELGRKATSGGSLAPYKDGSRDGWERNIYGNVFHKDPRYVGLDRRQYFDPELGRERPYYGYVHSTKHSSSTPYEPARQYGTTTFVFDPERVMDRASFTVGNSSGFNSGELKGAKMLGTPEYPAPLLRAVYERSQDGIGYTPASIAKDPQRLAEFKQEVARRLRNGDSFAGFKSYVEVQFVGDLGMNDVLAIVIPSEDQLYDGEKALIPYIKRLAKATGHEIVIKNKGDTQAVVQAKVRAAAERRKPKKK